MIPRVLIIEAKAGEAILSAYRILTNMSCNYYFATMLNSRDVVKSSTAFCKAHHWVYLENAYIDPILDQFTVPRLGVYTNFQDQENVYLAYYQNEMLKVKQRVDYLIKKVNPTHIVTNCGCISMYNIFIRFCVQKMFDKVFYYAEKPQTTKTDYLAVNELLLKQKIIKHSLSSKEIKEKIKIYKKYYGEDILKLYPNIFTYPEELIKL